MYFNRYCLYNYLKCVYTFLGDTLYMYQRFGQKYTYKVIYCSVTYKNKKWK